MAYSKPERKSHKGKKRVKLTRLDKDDVTRGVKRGAAAKFSQHMRDAREQARTGNHLERRKLKINKSNWKRYHGSREM